MSYQYYNEKKSLMIIDNRQHIDLVKCVHWTLHSVHAMCIYSLSNVNVSKAIASLWHKLKF